MRDGVNHGIYQSGGQIHARNIVVGDGARAGDVVQQAGTALEQRGLDELAERLLEVDRALVEHAAELEQPDEVRGALAQAAGELQQDKPNRLTVLSLLGGISSSVQSATGLASAIEGLIQTVQRLPG